MMTQKGTDVGKKGKTFSYFPCNMTTFVVSAEERDCILNLYQISFELTIYYYMDIS